MPRPHKQPLFQVNVETRDGKIIAVGPAMMEGACSILANDIKTQINLGREKDWSNPQVLPILNLEN